MAAGVRLTAAEREFLERKLAVQFDPKEKRLAESILDKLEKATMVKRKGPPGIEYGVLMGAFQEGLGSRLVAPMGGVVGMMLSRARTLGLTRSDCVTIARAAGAKWQGRIKAESLVRQAEVLLAEASDPHPSPREAAVVEMDEI